MAIVSIIYPVKSLLQDGLVLKAKQRYKSLDIEQIIITSCAKEQDISKNIHFIDTNSRAQRMNFGLSLSSCEFVVFHHPRSLLEIKAIEYLISHYAKLSWGAFTHTFDKSSLMLKFTSFYSNYIRGDLRGIYYLDHCLFARRSLLDEIKGFPDVDIFEDTDICKKLLSYDKPTRLHFKSTTSAIRFEKDGFWKQAYLNFLMKKDYYLGQDHKSMNKKYEENIGLNSDYE